MLLEPDNVDLGAQMKEALRLNASKDNAPEIQIPDGLIEFTQKCIACVDCMKDYKRYALLSWFMCHPAIKAYFIKGAEPIKLAWWMQELDARYQLHLTGLRADGSKYKITDDLAHAHAGVFVQRTVEAFSTF
jgi:hypothetical protein